MKNVFKELKGYTGWVMIIFLSVLAGVWCNLSLPNYMADIINQGVAGRDVMFILQTGAVMLVFALAGTACNVLTGLLSSQVAVGLGRGIRRKVFAKVESFSQSEMDRFSTASLITRTNNDILQLQNFMMMFLRVILMSPLIFAIGIVMAYMRSSDMSNILLLSMPVQLLIIFLIARKAAPLSESMQSKIDRVNLVIREKLTGIRVIRAFGTEEYEARRFDEANRDLTETSIQMQRTVTQMMPFLSLILNFSAVAILWIGGNRIQMGVQTGDILAVIQYVMQIMMSLTMLSMVFIMYPRAAASAQRIYEILDTVPVIGDPEGKKRGGEEKGFLEFQNVSFSFPNAETDAVRNISFIARPGETTAIIGSTGSGKTALINLIPRFYDVKEGRILVDGVDVRDYSQHELRAKIGYVPQKALLFQGTIRENIRFGQEDITDQQIEKAARISQSYDFIMEKPEGFDSLISQGGANMSGGQRQRLSIARAIARRPEIYIFDDSFSALDFKTDSALREALAKETREAAVLIVAQRVSTIMNADRILVLEHGELKGMGTHKELLAGCETYREIVSSQMSEEEMSL